MVYYKGCSLAMQPEALCGVDVEELQRKTVAAIEDGKAHDVLRKLATLPFDAILTTNCLLTTDMVKSITGCQ